LHEFAQQHQLDCYLEAQQAAADKAYTLANQQKDDKTAIAALKKSEAIEKAIELTSKPKNTANQQAQPFDKPEYWAAFTCQGLG
jgi:CHAT domain-containing protein